MGNQQCAAQSSTLVSNHTAHPPHAVLPVSSHYSGQPSVLQDRRHEFAGSGPDPPEQVPPGSVVSAAVFEGVASDDVATRHNHGHTSTDGGLVDRGGLQAFDAARSDFDDGVAATAPPSVGLPQPYILQLQSSPNGGHPLSSTSESLGERLGVMRVPGPRRLDSSLSGYTFNQSGTLPYSTFVLSSDTTNSLGPCQSACNNDASCVAWDM